MVIRKYLPVEKYILETSLPVEEIKRRLLDNIAPKRRRFSIVRKDSYKPYEGEMLDNTFTINRIIDYRNSFLPIIKGHISTFVDKTQIEIQMRPITLVLVFMCGWLGIVGIACLGIILAGLLQIRQILHDGCSPMFLIPFVMFLFGCIAMLFGFKTESKKSRVFLAQLFEGQETSM